MQRRNQKKGSVGHRRFTKTRRFQQGDVSLDSTLETKNRKQFFHHYGDETQMLDIQNTTEQSKLSSSGKVLFLKDNNFIETNHLCFIFVWVFYFHFCKQFWIFSCTLF